MSWSSVTQKASTSIGLIHGSSWGMKCTEKSENFPTSHSVFHFRSRNLRTVSEKSSLNYLLFNKNSTLHWRVFFWTFLKYACVLMIHYCNYQTFRKLSLCSIHRLHLTMFNAIISILKRESLATDDFGCGQLYDPINIVCQYFRFYRLSNLNWKASKTEALEVFKFKLNLFSFGIWK